MKYQIIDTHCHPQFPQYDADRDQVIRRAVDAGIGMICVGTDPESSRQAISLAEQYEGIWASVGIHPNDVGTFRNVESIMKLSEHPKVVAIGEIGLDYYRTHDVQVQQLQRDVLKDFLQTSKPLIIHCRDAHADMKKLLTGRGVIHSFTGTLADALHYIERGFYIGLNGIITFARDYDDAVRAIPLERILLETDAPYLAPVSKRGKRNEPVHILEVAQTIAQLKGTSIAVVMEKTTANARALFSI